MNKADVFPEAGPDSPLFDDYTFPIPLTKDCGNTASTETNIIETGKNPTSI